jgi:hypothetical protein
MGGHDERGRWIPDKKFLESPAQDKFLTKEDHLGYSISHLLEVF